MREVFREMLGAILDIFGDEIFSEPARLRAVMADLYAGDGYRKCRNLLNIAFGELNAYGRLRAIGQTSPQLVDILSKEMSRDFDILDSSAWAAIGSIGEILGIDAGEDGNISPPSVTFYNPPAADLFSVGDMVYFGKYYWRVLRVTDFGTLIITDEIIGSRAFGGADCRDWFTSELRQYLNETFYSKFSLSDRARIKQAQNRHSFDSERDALDYVSLLTPADAAILFDDNVDRSCTYNGAKSGWWLLCDPGSNNRNAHIVLKDGKISSLAAHLEGGVRPVLWLKP
ncbi:MAG: DUF6273 domain-containing protein [Defluviitaleaceae bacterium]|nr:DUF6273 domain-containing protein [Defluviitaleaceae bacterium]